MADYTYLNEVPIARVHKCNAESVAEEMADDIQRITNELLVMAASTPTEQPNDTSWQQHILWQIPTLIEELLGCEYKRWAAQYIIDNPGDVEDDLDAETVTT